MLAVSDQHNGAGSRTLSTPGRWLFATLMFVVGIVPVTAIAGAVGPASAPACPGATYSVVSGDSWSRIASRNGVTMTSLINANGATPATVIHPGQTLCLPTTTAVITTTTVATPAAAPAPAPAPAPSGVTIDVFPTQGLCSFSDTYGAPRGGGRAHEGVDIIAKAGQWVYAVKDGTLTKQYRDALGSLSGNGWRLTIAGGTYFFYAHLSAFAPGLSVGSTVKAGQIIGQVGMTGNAPIPHLHFEVHPGGGASVDPFPVVKANDGCRTTSVPPQPGDATPVTQPPVTAPPNTAPPTTVPPTAVPEPPTTVYVPVEHRRAVPVDPVVIPRPRR
jgi:hypothetical protein